MPKKKIYCSEKLPSGEIIPLCEWLFIDQNPIPTGQLMIDCLSPDNLKSNPAILNSPAVPPWEKNKDFACKEFKAKRSNKCIPSTALAFNSTGGMFNLEK